MRYSREITLTLKLNPTVFQVINQKAIGAFNTMCGGSTKAIMTLSSHTAEMEAIMPEILGISANTRDINFQEAVIKYLRSWYRTVPPEGVKLETGWDFDINDPIRHDRIMNWAKANGVDMSLQGKNLEKAIFDAMLFGNNTKVHEENLYLYMKPIKPADYIAWRICLLTSTVANKPEDIEKSTNIRFYLHSASDAKRMKEAKNRSNVETVKKLAELFGSNSTERIRDILICAYPTDVLRIAKLENVDLQIEITSLSQDKADLFNDLFAMQTIHERAQVYKLLSAQVITKDGDRYFDTNRPDIVLGSSVDGVVSYLADEKNAEYRKQLFAAYKAATLN